LVISPRRRKRHPFGCCCAASDRAVQEDGDAFNVRRGGWPGVVELQGPIGTLCIYAVEADETNMGAGWV
jgi:hypothetical protein